MNSTIAMQKIAQLNFDQIKLKLMHKQSGEGWTPARADAIEVEYRRFLCMMHLYPEESFAPLVDVDTFWHYHILDTRKYAADCQQAFGYFLHHHPYVGLGEDDAADHQAYGERMHALYQATFGEAVLSGVEGGTAWCSLTSAPAGEQSAWCSGSDSARQGAQVQQSAWCSLSAGASGQQAAWCSGAYSVRAQSMNTAWCSRVDTEKANAVMAKQTAWCSRVDSVQAKATAWCSRVDSVQSKQTAWCSRVDSAQATAWCSRVDGMQTQATAWCSAPAS